MEHKYAPETSIVLSQIWKRHLLSLLRARRAALPTSRTNCKPLKDDLCVRLGFPTYRDGLAALMQDDRAGTPALK